MSDWTKDALCREVGTEIFFPPPDDTAAGYAMALRVCTACPVREPCLDYAMEREGANKRDRRAGMWGGLTASQRYQLHLQRTGQEAAA